LQNEESCNQVEDEIEIDKLIIGINNKQNEIYKSITSTGAVERKMVKK